MIFVIYLIAPIFELRVNQLNQVLILVKNAFQQSLPFSLFPRLLLYLCS